MDKFKTFSGIVAPLDKNNIDTDAIIPKQYLKSISRTGFGVSLDIIMLKDKKTTTLY